MVRCVKPAGDERTPDGAAHAEVGPAREQLLNTTTDERDDAVVVRVDGEIDGLTAPRLRTAIAAAFDRLGERVLVLDLTEVQFLGSAGLRTLLDSAAEAMHHDGYQPLRVVVDENRPVIRPIEIVGLDNVLALYHSVNDALAS